MTRAMARNAGQVLLWTGFIAAALVSTRQIGVVEWGAYAATFAVGAAGVVVLRATSRRSAEEQAAASSGIAALSTNLNNVCNWLKQHNGTSDTMDVYEIHARIDEHLAPELRAFADGREAIIDARGLDTYAAVMSQFATAERTINRAWSASADGYIDEVRVCLERAESLLRDAAATLENSRPQSEK